MWTRALGRLWLPMVWLVLVGLWMATDMQATPQGQVDFPVSHDLRQPKDWLKPIALSPQRLRETVIDPGVRLNNIHCSSSQSCWAVGDGGTILATTNGGRSWQIQASKTTQQFLSSVTFDADGLRGWAVGDVGTILATTDGGHSWQIQTSDATQLLLTSVTIHPNGLRGWAVGNVGTILATTDGGHTWQAQNSSTKQPLYSVTFNADGLRGWAVGDVGTILATTDGGHTWQAQNSSTKQPLYSVTFNADGLRGWAVGDVGTILATTDGGRSWQAQGSMIKQLLIGVTFNADGLRGWAVGDSGTILTTTDAGRSWQVQASNTTRFLFSVTFDANGQLGWCVGTDGTILVTFDSGHSWQAQARGTTEAYASAAYHADGKRAWLVGMNGTIKYTSNGGLHWQLQNSGIAKPLWGIAFHADGQRGWAVGDGGTILTTSDAGHSWHSQVSGSTELLTKVNFNPDGLRGWVLGTGCTILATSDAGRSWQVQTCSSTNDLRDLAFNTDGLRGWIVGNGGTILATTDGGHTWLTQTSGTTQDLFRVRFQADGMHGRVTGDNNTILATSDGGQTWQVQANGTWEDFSSRVPGIDPRVGQQHGELYPSPAAWLALLFGLLWLATHLTRASANPDALRHPDEGGVHDNPITHPDDDRLAQMPLARALAWLLGNQDTRPPLAVAVCAPWGVGKSSLLGLLAHALRQQGASPVWFNAWHYREDTQMLAALMEHIKDQVPQATSPWMRLRLAWLRGLKPLLPLLVLPLLAALVGLWGWSDQAHHNLQATAHQVASNFKGIGLPPWLQQFWPALWQVLADNGVVLSSLAAVLAIGSAIGRWAKPFTPRLQRLLKASELADMQRDAGFRYQFQREFGELCQALGPGKLVLIIDDLDRCDPTQIDKVMSTLNFLFASARCHAVLGMDWNYVRTAVGLAYKDMAKALANNAQAATDAANQASFGENFLGKIVQLRLTLPVQPAAPVVLRGQAPALDTRVWQPAITLNQQWQWLTGLLTQVWFNRGKLRQGLAQQRKPLHRQMAKALVAAGRWAVHALARLVSQMEPGALWRTVQWGMVVAATALATTLLGQYMEGLNMAGAGTGQPAGTANVSTVPPIPQQVNPPPVEAPRQKVFDGSAVVTRPPDVNAVPSLVWWGGPVLAWLCGLAWAGWVMQLVRDSAAFREAIQQWRFDLGRVLNTPREWRRFQNMARFAAMRLRASDTTYRGARNVLRQAAGRYRRWVLGQALAVVPAPLMPPNTRERLMISLLAQDLFSQGQLVGALKAHLDQLRHAMAIHPALANRAMRFSHHVQQWQNQHDDARLPVHETTRTWLQAWQTATGEPASQTSHPNKAWSPPATWNAVEAQCNLFSATATDTPGNPLACELGEAIRWLHGQTMDEVPFLTPEETRAFINRLDIWPLHMQMQPDTDLIAAIRPILARWLAWHDMALMVDTANLLRNERKVENIQTPAPNQP